MDIKKVCVFCASSTKVPKEYFDATALLGKTLAQNNIAVVYGGGSVGLMGALADAVLKEKGKIIGVIPKFMMELEWGNPDATQLIVTEDIPERKKKLIEGVDAVIALPGGTGTLEELSEVISMKKLGLFLKPIILLNTNNFFEHFIAFTDRMISDNFIHQEHKNVFTVAEKPESIIDVIKNSHPWTKDDFRHAAI